MTDAIPSRVANPWLDDGDVQLWHGDVIDTLRGLPAGVAQTCVTSPPYWGLRDYGTGDWMGGDAECGHLAPPKGGAQAGSTLSTLGPKRDGLGPDNSAWAESSGAQYRDVCGRCGARRVDSQLGLEATPELYVERMVAVFREVWRVLRDDGTCWINLGDCYAHGAPSGTAGQWNGSSPLGKNGNAENATKAQNAIAGGTLGPGLKPKDLVGIPWRVAFALQSDGWYLRSDIIWAKPNPMPESVTDRPTKSHEYLFLLTKRPRYFYDADAIREPADEGSIAREGRARLTAYSAPGQSPNRRNGSDGEWQTAGRNRRSVWTIPTQPYAEAHFATYPEALVRPCILAGTSERGECAACGAPWVREVERGDFTPSNGRGGSVHSADYAVRVQSKTGGSGVGQVGDGFGRYERETTGWRASCECAPEPSSPGAFASDGSVPAPRGASIIPQTVLDPFIGSGTTALVARKHGRRCIGIDLSVDYLGIAARRLQQLSLFADPGGHSEDTPEAECV